MRETEIICDDGSVYWEVAGEHFSATVLPEERLVQIRIGCHEAAIEIPIERVQEVVADLQAVVAAAS